MSYEKSLSIIIPVKNTGAYLSELLLSLESQEGDLINDWCVDIIFVNDNSTDSLTLDILSKLPEKINIFSVILINSSVDLGISAARNIGVKNTNNTWVAFLDSDDLYTVDSINLRLQAIDIHPESCFISGDIYYWNQYLLEQFPGKLRYKSTGLVRERITNRDTKNNKIDLFYVENSFEKFFETLPVHTNTVTLKRELFEFVGGFDILLRRCEDTDLWMRLSREVDLLYIDAPLAVYRRNTNGITFTVENEANYVISYLRGLIKTENDASRLFLLNMRLYQVYLDALYYEAYSGNFIESIKLWVNAVKVKKTDLRNIKYFKLIPLSLVNFISMKWRSK